jgi:hypothetical protein
VVVEEILGVVKEVPLPKEDPPAEAAYQFKIPAFAVALRTTSPASQREPGVTDVTSGVVFIVAVTSVLSEVQPLLLAST